MREYKFRGKDKKRDWIYGSLYRDNPQNCWYITDNETEIGIEVEENTIGQYTGLKDKNKKEIYEGDILKYAGGGIYVVVFDEMMIMCPQDKIEMPSPGYYGILIGDKAKELCPLGITQRLARVIGNIYDNPELLEEGGNKL